MNQPRLVHLSTKLSTERPFINSLHLVINPLLGAAAKNDKWIDGIVISRLNQTFCRSKLFFNLQFRSQVEKAHQEVIGTA